MDIVLIKNGERPGERDVTMYTVDATVELTLIEGE